MNIEAQVLFWRRSAREDWDAAWELVRSGRTRHGLFFAHLALEKALKAHVCIRTSSVPPRIHNLVRLVQLAQIVVDEMQLDLLAEMNAFNIEGRYPDTLTTPPRKTEAKDYMRRGEEVFEWLMMQS